MDWLDVAREVVDVEVVLESVVLGFGFGLSALFNRVYNNHKVTYEKVKSVPEVALDKTFLQSVREGPGDFEYVAISGQVQASGKVLQSRYFSERKGVILNFITEERRETWAKYSQVWYENDKELSNVMEAVPFSLTDGRDGSVCVHITDPLSSAWCASSLSVINKEFRGANSSVMDSIIGLATGDRVKGYTDTERMLQVGTRLLGIGELVVEDNILKLKKPADHEYILTTATLGDVISYFKGRVKLWRVLRLIILGAALGGLWFFLKSIRKKYFKAWNDRYMRLELGEVRKQRNRPFGNAADCNQDEKCVICLTNPRECVILDCGHVCACVDCIDTLPMPRTCPMCRANIVRIIPLFHA